LGPAEWWLRVDDPSLLSELGAEAEEALCIGETGGSAVEAELGLPVRVAQAREHLAAEEFAHDPHWKEEVRKRADPSLSIERQPATSDDAVDVWMKEQLSRPGVEDAGDAELGAEAMGIATELEQCLRSASEEHVEDLFAIDERQRAKLRWK